MGWKLDVINIEVFAERVPKGKGKAGQMQSEDRQGISKERKRQGKCNQDRQGIGKEGKRQR